MYLHVHMMFSYLSFHVPLLPSSILFSNLRSIHVFTCAHGILVSIVSRTATAFLRSYFIVIMGITHLFRVLGGGTVP